MNIIIKTKNLELTDSLKSYINKRIDGLKKFVKELPEVFLEIEKETLHHKNGQIFRTEATAHLPKKSLVAESKGDDLGKTIIAVRDELKRQIREHKLKIIEKLRRVAKKSQKDIRTL